MEEDGARTVLMDLWLVTRGGQGQHLEPGAGLGAGHLEVVVSVHGGGVGNDALVAGHQGDSVPGDEGPKARHLTHRAGLDSLLKMRSEH